MHKFRFYTDGVKTIKVKEGEVPPEGFHAGRTFNHRSWNRGKTKETDERIRKNVEAMRQTLLSNGSYEKPWNKGLTKETSPILQRVASKVSEATLGKTAWNKGVPCSEETKRKISEANTGNPIWNKGLTKETDERVRSTSEKLMGHECFVTDWDEAVRKCHDTMKANDSYGKSKPEEEYYEYLVSLYGVDDVERQYRSELYPFNCDFYIKSKDLYIEYNGTWLHGEHPFDIESEEDKALVALWDSKDDSKTAYKKAVYIWTDLDVRKLETFRKNKLNFQIIYPKSNLIICE